MTPHRFCAGLVAITLGAAGVASAQTVPGLEVKERAGAASTSMLAPQLAPYQATPLAIPPVLAAPTGGIRSQPAFATGGAIVDARPSCAMPVAAAPAARGDSMVAQRTDAARLERMPVMPSRCRNTP